MNLKEYNEAQVKEMEINKWIESEKAGHDLGEACNRKWIREHAAEFRATHPLDTDK